MDIYEQISNEISNMKYDKPKVYKFILLLACIDYAKDYNDIDLLFNKDIHYSNVLDYYTNYLLSNQFMDNNVINKEGSLSLKEITFNLRANPLRHIITGTSFLENDDKDKNSRKIENLPSILRFNIKEDFDKQEMLFTIELAAKLKIQEICNDFKVHNNFDEMYKTAGLYTYRKKLIEKFNCKCALCSIDFDALLVASHAKPRRACDNTHEVLSDNNGLLLCGNHDKLFDKGYISIDIKNREILYSDRLKNKDFYKTGINFDYNQIFKEDTRYIKYFDYHKKYIFK